MSQTIDLRRVGVAALTIGLLELCSAPARAATVEPSRPDVHGCFAFTDHRPYAGAPVILESWDTDASSWAHTRSATTGTSGCIRFNRVRTGEEWRLEAYRVEGAPRCEYYSGTSRTVRTPHGDTTYEAGTTEVRGPYPVHPC